MTKVVSRWLLTVPFRLFWFCGHRTHAQVYGRQKNKYCFAKNHELSRSQFWASFIFGFNIKTCQISTAHLVTLTGDRNRTLENFIEFHCKRKSLNFGKNGWQKFARRNKHRNKSIMLVFTAPILLQVPAIIHFLRWLICFFILRDVLDTSHGLKTNQFAKLTYLFFSLK